MVNISAGLISAAERLLSSKTVVFFIVIITAATGMLVLTATGNNYLNTFSGFTSDGNVHKSNYSESVVTVVTTYYRIPSKHNASEYMNWIQNFLTKIPCHLYVFTSSAMHSKLAPLRSKFQNRTRFIIKEFEELDEYSKMDRWKQINAIDPENSYHSPEVYVVWNQKWRFVEYAIQENVFQSEYFIWCDIGSFRSSELADRLGGFPNPRTVQEKLQDHTKLIFNLMSPFSGDNAEDNTSFKKSLRGVNTVGDHVGGGIVAGHREAWKVWISRYYSMQKLFFKLGLNAGKEQNVMNAVVYRSLSNVELVKPEGYFNGTGDPWFFLQFYFS